MKKIGKAITKLFWSESQNNMVLATDHEASFHVSLGRLLVGTLVFSDGLWHFSYSEDFKSQNRIMPLTNFPSKDIEYTAKELWPFFASRIPSDAQLQIEKDSNREDIVSLLRRFGRWTIANPYELTPVV